MHAGELMHSSSGHLGLEVLLYRKWKSNKELKKPVLHVFHDSVCGLLA